MNNWQEQQEINNEATRWDYNQEAFGGSVEGPEWMPSNEEVMEILSHEHEKYGHAEIVKHCPLCESDEPDYVGYEGRRPVMEKFKAGTPVKVHVAGRLAEHFSSPLYVVVKYEQTSIGHNRKDRQVCLYSVQNRCYTYADEDWLEDISDDVLVALNKT